MEAPAVRLERCIMCHDHGKTYPLEILSCGHKVHQLCFDNSLRALDHHRFEFYCPADRSLLDPTKEVFLNKKISFYKNCNDFLKNCLSNSGAVFVTHLIMHTIFYKAIYPGDRIIDKTFILGGFLALLFCRLIRDNDIIPDFILKIVHFVLDTMFLLVFTPFRYLAGTQFFVELLIWNALWYYVRHHCEDIYIKDSSLDSVNHLFNLIKTDRFPSLHCTDRVDSDTLLLEFDDLMKAKVFKENLLEIPSYSDLDKELQLQIKIKKEKVISFDGALKLMRNYKEKIKNKNLS